MIVDCHTQIWDRSLAGKMAAAEMVRVDVKADAAYHAEAVHTVDRAFVLGFKSSYLQAEIPNQFVADHVKRFASKLIGFAGIDPTDANWQDELRIAHDELSLKGVTICPPLQNYHPTDTRAMELYEECARRGLPVIIDQSMHNPAAKMEYARPMLLDEVAREFPQLRVVVAHMGYPWVDETLVLLAKHPHVFANVAGLLRRPWLSYNALLSAYEFGVVGKLLFGSDFPYRSPAACIETLYSINHFAHGTSLTAIPREQLRGIVERDALSLLGIEKPAGAIRTAEVRTLFEEE